MSEIIATVIIPVYNAAHMIEECLNSIAAQDFPQENMQVVIGDNGSNDGTREIIQAKFPQFEMATATDRGCGFARNAALPHARGKYICCTDSDCVIDPKWVSSMVKAFDTAPESVASFGGQIQPYRTQTPVENFRTAWVQQEALRDRKDLAYAETPNAAFRRWVFDKVGMFDGTLGFPDADMGIRLHEHGYEVRYAPDAIVRHRNPITVKELFNHRRKYGIFQTRLARKYKERFGDPDAAGVLSSCRTQTVRRVLGNVVKLPVSLIAGDKRGVRIAPFFDALVAVANYQGVRQAYREHR